MKAINIVEINTVKNSNFTAKDVLLDSLNHLQVYVLHAIEQLEAQEMQQELVRFQQRKQLNNQAIANTLEDFATIFDTQIRNTSVIQQPLKQEEALLVAAGAVGKVLGITIACRVPHQQ